MKKDKFILKRYAAIIEVLNSMQVVKIETIREKVSKKMDYEYSKSTIEKDLQNLKLDFDIEYRAVVTKGIQLIERVDYIERLTAYLNIN